LTLAPSLPWALVSVMLAVFALSLGRPAIGSAVSRTAGAHQGLVLGTLASFESLGRAVGPLWAGAAYGWWVQAPFLSAAFLHGAALLACFRLLWSGSPDKSTEGKETLNKKGTRVRVRI